MPYRSVRVAQIRGFELRLDPSLFILVTLLVWAFASRFAATHGIGPALVMAVSGSLLVVATTLLHELAHAFEASHRGIEVDAITLLLFGGVTEMHTNRPTARDELAVAAVGPYISLVTAAVFGLSSTYATELVPGITGTRIAEVAGILGWWNLALAAFNIVPGAPLDGGRILRGLLWMLLGDRLRALRASVRAGQALAIALVGFGVWIATRPTPQTVTAIAIGAIFVITAVGLFHAATSELKQAELDAVLSDHRVSDVLVHSPGHPTAPVTARIVTVPLDADLHALVAVFRDGGRQVRVVSAGSDVTILTETDVAQALRALRQHRSGRGRSRQLETDGA